MNPKQVKLLATACKMAGLDASKIKPENPFTKSGLTASLLQASIAELDPQQAAKWRVEAGGGLSVATLAELESLPDGQAHLASAAAKQDLWEHDADFVAEHIQQKVTAEQQALAWMDQEADRMRRGREGDKAVDAQIAKDQAAAEARAESQRHAAEMEKRIVQRRQQADALAGRLV